MNTMQNAFVLLAAVLVPLACVAQQEEDEDGPVAYSYATYMYCKVGEANEARVDEIAKENAAVFDAVLEEGTMTAWGWLAHQTGGKWRRLSYFSADTIEALWDVQDALNEKFAALPDGGNNAEFFKLCYAHDDYVWGVLAGSDTDSRGDVSMSVYHVCDIAREDRADEIMKNDFAPVMDKAVEDGKIASWGWLSHIVGGKYRRLQTMTGESYQSVLKARGEILGAILDMESAQEFTDICGSHSDYLWDIQIEHP